MTQSSIGIETAEAHQRAGRLDLAVPIYRSVIAADPAHGEAHKMLAIALFQGGATDEAEHIARRAVALKPSSPDAANILAAILGRTGRYDEAVRVLLPLGARIEKFPGICLNLGLALRGTRDFAGAVKWLERAIAGDPKLPGAHENLGMVLADLGRRDEALAALREAVALDSDNGNARHMLAALDGASPAAPPDSYVRALFNDYAPRFERELVNALDYRIPGILRQMIYGDSAGESQRRFTRALDLGCGTGLSGAAVQDCVDEIVGVDLAEAMIGEARAKKIYNALFVMPIARYLGSNDARRKPFDLVIAADVFVYVGELDGVFAAIAARMSVGGLFAFSIEGGADEDRVVLCDTGRYAHGAAYIDRLARTHGFIPAARRPAAIRKAHAGTVDGLAIVLRKA